MKKINQFAVVTFLCIVALASFNAKAQSSNEIPKMDVGLQYSTITFGSATIHGASTLFAYNFNKYLSADNSFTLFPRQQGAPTATYSGLFGAKIGMRADKFGVFVKARPGFLNLGPSSTKYVTDLGGVVEIYQSRRIGYRIDVGHIVVKSGAGPISMMNMSGGVMLRF